MHFVLFDEELLADAEEALSEEAARHGACRGIVGSGRPPLESHEEYDWFVQFASSVDDPGPGTSSR